MNQETKKVFSPRPMVSFRSHRKISSYLVSAKLCPLDDQQDPWNVARKSEVYVNVFETNNVTGET